MVYTIIIILAVTVGIAALIGAFKKKEPSITEECRDECEVLIKQISRCDSHKELQDIDVRLDKFYEYYYSKVRYDILNQLFKRLLDALEYKRVNL
jgi:hypothetical protein